MDCSLSGSSIHGIFQARVLEWIAMSFSRISSRPRNRIQVSLIAGRRFTVWATREALLENNAVVKKKKKNQIIHKSLKQQWVSFLACFHHWSVPHKQASVVFVFYFFPWLPFNNILVDWFLVWLLESIDFLYKRWRENISQKTNIRVFLVAQW